MEIANFYTATIYNKGAEVIRMMRTMLGPEKFRAGTDLYFERHDGQAVTCEDFVARDGGWRAASTSTQFRLLVQPGGHAARHARRWRMTATRRAARARADDAADARASRTSRRWRSRCRLALFGAETGSQA